MSDKNKTAVETGIENLEARFTRWLRLFETEHQARVLDLEVNRDEAGEVVEVKMLVRPITDLGGRQNR